MLGSLGSGHHKVVTEPPILPKEESVSRHKRGKYRALTERQRRVLEVIRRHCKEGLPPTRAQIAEELGLTNISAIDGHLFRLSARGFLQLFPRVERGIRLLREGAPLYEDPAELLAEAGGVRIVDLEGGEQKRLHDFDSFAVTFEAHPDLFVQITDDSLEPAGYREGDIVAVACDVEPQEGDVVVAKIGDAVAIKCLFHGDEGGIELRPGSSDPEHEVVRVDPGSTDVELIGVVVGAIIGARRASSASGER